MAPRLSIIAGDFAEEARADVLHFRILSLIGRHTDKKGWCRLKQAGIAEKLDVTRETVCRKIKDLVDWGYIEKRAHDATGRAIFYRTILDRPGPIPEPTPSDDELENDDVASDAAADGPVRDGSHVGYNPDSELHTTCDPALTPDVIPTVTSDVSVRNHTERPFSNDKNPLSHGANRTTGKKRKSMGDVEAVVAELVELGAPRTPVERFLKPILLNRRVSMENKTAELVRLAKSADGMAEAWLDRAARWVLDSGVQTIKRQRLAEALEKSRKSGDMVIIHLGTPQWHRWVEYSRKAERREKAVMERFDKWQVPSEWPPSASTKPTGDAA